MLKPLTNLVIIDPIWPEQKTESGIILGNQEGQTELLREVYPTTAVIIAIGSGVSGFEIGETVAFSRWGCRDLCLEDNNWWVINKKDIVAKCE